MAVVALLSPLSQFGLFYQPQTSFTRSKNRESFTTLQRVSLRIETRRIQWKIMLTTFLRKIAPLRSQDGVILFEEIGNSNRCHIFLMEYKAPCDAWLALFCEEKSKKAFLLVRKLLQPRCFSMKDCERTPSNFLYHVKKELSSPGLLREFWLNCLFNRIK